VATVSALLLSPSPLYLSSSLLLLSTSPLSSSPLYLSPLFFSSLPLPSLLLLSQSYSIVTLLLD
jgi:hypothetical protein